MEHFEGNALNNKIRHANFAAKKCIHSRRLSFAMRLKKRWPMVCKKTDKESTKTVLLSGGNPQIPKGDGDIPVQAYIEAMPK